MRVESEITLDNKQKLIKSIGEIKDEKIINVIKYFVDGCLGNYKN